VVFLSQRGDFASRVAAVRAGGAAFLTLPLQLDALYLWMEALTRRRPQVPYRVLLVDDEAANVQLHARFLREASMVTHCVTDPREVSEAVQEFHPDVVLMEWAMPHCSGLELAAVLRQQDALLALPIVFLASEDRLDQRMEALAQGGDDFLVKPVQAELLVSSVATRARRYRAIGAQLCRDGLTGLLNHRKLKEDLTLELARARRNQSPLAFAMLDLDHFKDVNDHCGHPAGDEVLKTLARLIVQRVRRTDSVGRYGGEEFGIIFPDSTSEQAFALLDEIRIQFGSTLHRSGDVVFQVTLSGGIASYPECKEGRELILAADKALYRAKRGGRDRLAVAAGP
jgi:diguanylate cyclase (GGDEF)-like protein